MGILDKLLNEDPLHILDDDHPERPTISTEEFGQTLQEIIIKYKLKDKKTVQKTSPFTDGMIEATNAIED